MPFRCVYDGVRSKGIEKISEYSPVFRSSCLTECPTPGVPITWINDGNAAQSNGPTSISSGLTVGPGGGVGTVIDSVLDSTEFPSV